MDTSITSTILPPKSGYVEVIENGRHIYKNIKPNNTVEEVSSQEDTAEMLVDHEYRITLLELGITE